LSDCFECYGTGYVCDVCQEDGAHPDDFCEDCEVDLCVGCKAQHECVTVADSE
jgi:hypothetical protein